MNEDWPVGATVYFTYTYGYWRKSQYDDSRYFVAEETRFAEGRVVSSGESNVAVWIDADSMTKNSDDFPDGRLAFKDPEELALSVNCAAADHLMMSNDMARKLGNFK